MLIRYEVEYFEEETMIHKIERGFVCVNTYGESVEKIYEYYGAENVESVKIYEYDNLLNDEEIEEIIKNH